MVGLVSASVDTYLTTALLIAVPWLYFTLRLRPSPSFLQAQAQSQSQLRPPSPNRTLPTKFISLFLLLHTLYILHALILAAPPNLFTALKLPVNTPTDAIRAVLLQLSDEGSLPPHLDALLRRLGSFDMRSIYIRFGHNVLATCEYCRSYEDFLLFALPRPLLSYIREIAVVGLVTLESNNRAHLRSFGIGTLILAAGAEIYWICAGEITIPSRDTQDTPVFMWHDNLLTLRHLLFLLLPLAIQHLPSLIPSTLRIPLLPRLLHPPPTLPAPQKAHILQSTLHTLDHLLPALHLLKYTRASLMRVPELRAQSSAWWEREAREGGWVRTDEGVQRAARGVGVGFDDAGWDGEGGEEGKLRTSARMAVDALKAGAVPSEHWRVPAE